MKMEDIHCVSTSIDEKTTAPVNIAKLKSEISSSVLEENMEQLELVDNITEDVKLESEDFSDNTLKAPTSNRRYSLRPQRRLQKTEYAVTPMKKKHLSMKKNNCLETIFEDPQDKNGSIILLGRALKRSITFTDNINLTKIKRRRLKVKRLLKASNRKPIKISLEDVQRKLMCLEECEEAEWMGITNCTK